MLEILMIVKLRNVQFSAKRLPKSLSDTMSKNGQTNRQTDRFETKRCIMTFFN